MVSDVHVAVQRILYLSLPHLSAPHLTEVMHKVTSDGQAVHFPQVENILCF
jgi:hypothetical protein